MKIYKASQELINILLANGFIEDTIKIYPEHAKRLVGSNYDPHGMKRHFYYPRTREKVYFDYINIILPTGVEKYEMDTNDVRSLIAFCQLSSADRSALVNERYNVLSIPQIISDIAREPRIYSTAVCKRAKSTFENLENIE